ncbi:MAG: BamA/TamA family outer membrane protein [Cytophagales bacterium]
MGRVLDFYLAFLLHKSKGFSLKLLGLCVFLFLQSCSYTPFLGKQEYLLNRQQIKGNKNIATEDLSQFFKVKPNRKLPILGTKPYLYFYLIGKQSFDSSKVSQRIVEHDSLFSLKIREIPETDTNRIRKTIKKRDKKGKKLLAKKEKGNWLMRVVGEKPVLLDTAIVSKTLKEFISLYQVSGFFDVQAYYSLDTIGKNVNVTYSIKESQPYKIVEFDVNSDDAEIKKVVKNDPKSWVKKGDVFNENNLSKERDRLTLKLRDMGYFDFTKDFIRFEVDSFGSNKTVWVEMYIEKRSNGDVHKKYFIKDIQVEIDADRKVNKSKRSSKGVTYQYAEKFYSTYVLDKKIAIKINKPYSNTESQKTLNRLNRIDMFRFSNLNYIKEGDSLRAFIRLSSMSRYRISDEFGVNTNINQQVPGPFGSIVFMNRNTLRGCEIFEVGARAGIEGQASAIDPNLVYQTTEINGNVSLTYPLVLFPFVGRGVAPDFDPRTRFIASYTYTSRPEFSRSVTRGAITYLFQTGQFSRISVSPIDLNIIDANIKDTLFEERLSLLVAQGNNLINTFYRSIISYMGVSYTFNNNDFLSNKRSYYFRVGGELGGLTLGMIQNTLRNPDIPIKDDELFGLPFFKFIRLNTEFRNNQPISRKSAIAYRIFSGVVLPYDGFKTIPYDKYFFSGGSNSIRAWRPRRLGPGGFAQKDDNGRVNYNFEQPGDIQLEFNVESRFKIYKFLAGALFIDAGNVWTLEESPNRPGTVFKLNNLQNQIAIGTGFGIRLDFSFFVFRLDLGIKTFDPAQNDGERWVIRKFRTVDLLGRDEKVIYNFSVGYPF